MAFERSPASPALDEHTVDALRAVLARSVINGAHDTKLRDLLCTTAMEARTKGIQAEQLLIILKDMWHSLPELLAKTSSDVDNTLLQELISRCIQEYYAV